MTNVPVVSALAGSQFTYIGVPDMLYSQSTCQRSYREGKTADAHQGPDHVADADAVHGRRVCRAGRANRFQFVCRVLYVSYVCVHGAEEQRSGWGVQQFALVGAGRRNGSPTTDGQGPAASWLGRTSRFTGPLFGRRETEGTCREYRPHDGPLCSPL